MAENTILLLVGRDDWQKDEALNLALHNRLKENRIEIVWEDPAGKVIHALRKAEKKIPFISKKIKNLNLRITQVLYGLFHPSYFSYLYKRKGISILARCELLKKTIRKQSIGARVVILSRSSGGRVSSLIADQLGIKQIICIGYPFKHPNYHDEPERYEHLAHLQTPMLIIQGVNDEYGGLEIQNNYRLSDKIQVVFFNTNHNFDIDRAAVDELVDLIESYMGLCKKYNKEDAADAPKAREADY